MHNVSDGVIANQHFPWQYLIAAAFYTVLEITCIIAMKKSFAVLVIGEFLACILEYAGELTLWISGGDDTKGQKVCGLFAVIIIISLVVPLVIAGHRGYTLHETIAWVESFLIIPFLILIAILYYIFNQRFIVPIINASPKQKDEDVS